MSHAILLLAHGTPDRLSQMAEYLARVTGGRPMPQHVVEELQHRYAEIGLRDTPLPERLRLGSSPRLEDRPPLTRWTLLQGKLLAEALGQPVYVAMRNWHPLIADIVAQMKRDGVTEATVLCLAPQNSRTSTGLYRRALDTALVQTGPATDGPALTYTWHAGWAHEPLLALAFAERLWPAWAEACAKASLTAGKPVRVPVLFTAHSVPCRTVRAATPEEAARGSAARPGAPVPAQGIQNYGVATTGDPYPIECKQTATAVAHLLSAIGMTEADWVFAFQSQGIAGAPWLGPSVEDTFKALADAGHTAVVMQPIGFLCDHVEILYDIDINFRATGRTLGLEVTRAESLNDSPTLIRALQKVLTPSTDSLQAGKLKALSSFATAPAEILTQPLPQPTAEPDLALV